MTAPPIQRVTLADIPPDRIITIPAAGLRPIADPVALIVERVRMTPVRPVTPVAPYFGGKRNLAKRVISRIARVPHVAYVEPFVGMGGIFLRRPFKVGSEVINDISGDVVVLYRILQHHYQAFMDVLRWQLTSREHFERLLAENPDSLTDLRRAARFLYLQRVAYGGKLRGRNFGMAMDGRGGRFNVTTLGPLLEDVHERLAGVVIERLPWHSVIPRYDRPGTLFYLDPPYWGCEDDYGLGVFSRDDFQRLAEVLGAIQGRFIMTLNDTPGVRDTFRGFTVEGIETTYTIAGKPSRAAEVLISNLPPDT
jgi:DNA adenine methylase